MNTRVMGISATGSARRNGWLRVNDAAGLLGVSLNTLRRWSDSGKLACYRSSGGHRRFKREDVEALLAAQEQSRPAAPPASARATVRERSPCSLTVPELRRRVNDLSVIVDAGLEDAERHNVEDVLRAVARRLAEATRSPVADIYAVEDGTIRALVSYDNGTFDPSWEGQTFRIADYPATHQAIESLQVRVVASLDDPVLTPEVRASLASWGYQSQLSLPLVAHGEVIGLAELSDTVPRDYAEELELIRGLAVVAARAIDNARLFEQVERRNGVLRELVAIGTLVSQSHDVDELLHSVAQRLLTTLDAVDCDIYKIQEKGAFTCLVSVDRTGYDESVLGKPLRFDLFPLLMEAVRSGEAVTVHDRTDSRLSDDDLAVYDEYGFESEMCVPLVVDGRTVGVIEVYDDHPRDFAQYLDFMRSAAQIIGSAMEKALLYRQGERRSRVLKALVDLGALTAQSPDIDAFLREVTRRFAQTIEAADCEIFLSDDHGELRCRASYHRDDGFDEDWVGTVLEAEDYPLTAQLASAGQVLVVSNPDDPRLNPAERAVFERFGFLSELCIPLVVGKRLIGLIDVFDDRERDFAEYLDFITSAGQMVAGALENRFLLEQVSDRNRMLRELVELSALVSQEHELEPLLHTVARRFVDALGLAWCDFHVREGDSFRFLTSVDREGRLDPDVSGQELDFARFPTTREAVEERHMVLFSSPDDPRLSEAERELYAHYGLTSELIVPLVSEDKVIGLVDLWDDRERDFARETDFVRSAGQIVAGALQNALLLDRLEDSNKDLAVLVDSGFEFGSTLDLDTTLPAMARRMCAAGAADCCDVYLLEGEVLRGLVSADGDVIDASFPGTVYRLDEPHTFIRVLETLQPVAVYDAEASTEISEWARQELRRWGYRSELCLPLIAGGKAVGCALLCYRDPHRHGSLDVLLGLVNLAAQAIVNGGLFRDVEVRRRETELLNRIASATAASLDVEEITAAAIEELRNFARFERATLVLVEDDEWVRFAYLWGARRAGPERRALRDEERALLARLRWERTAHVDLENDGVLGHPEALRGMRVALIVGLVSGDRVIGLLNLASAQSDAFEGVDRSLLERVAGHLSLAINNARLYQNIKRMHLGNLKALSSALNAKDYYTFGHAARVSAYMMLLGHELGWERDFVRQVEEVAYLHDIGKIGVSDRVLQKPSGLNLKEWELMRQHPMFSAEIIAALFAPELTLGVRHHHERWDGRGYPDGLAGEEIPLVARAMCVADSYDAMSFRRPYRAALSYSESVAELRRCSGTQFDPEMVLVFLRVLAQIGEQRAAALAIAQQAAARIDGDKHDLLRGPADEARPEYAEIEAMLRKVRDANPAARHLTTHARRDHRYVIVVDCEEDPEKRSHIGHEVFVDEELPEVFEGTRPDTNMLCVDEWGVWCSAVAPVFDSRGEVAAVVSADLPPLRGVELEGLGSEVTQTFAAMLQTAAVRLSRAEIDAITDGLTGLYNHRYLHERLAEEIDRAAEAGVELALLFLDIDHFKRFNDRHGHSTGDRALRGVARIIESCVRKIDLAARYGGEEFVVVLPDTGLEGGLRTAERIRQAVEQAHLTPGEDSISVSVGVATYPHDAALKEELLDKADWAMYLAKRRGRNRTAQFASGESFDDGAAE